MNGSRNTCGDLAFDALEIASEKPILEDDDVWLRTGYRRRPLARVAFGKTLFYTDRMEFIPGEGDKMVFMLKSITGLNVFKQHFLEFHYNQKLYRLDFEGKSTSGYKWMCLFYALLELKNQEKAL